MIDISGYSSFSEQENRISTIRKQAALMDRFKYDASSTRYSLTAIFTTLSSGAGYSNNYDLVGGAFAMATLFCVFQSRLKSQDAIKPFESGYISSQRSEKIAIADYEKRLSWDSPEVKPA